MTKIDKLEEKYLVLKKEDIDTRINKHGQNELKDLVDVINSDRKQDGKQPQKYVVLNINDEISLDYLIDILKRRHYIDSGECEGTYEIVKIKTIAVDLVNAIMAAKVE